MIPIIMGPNSAGNDSFSLGMDDLKISASTGKPRSPEVYMVCPQWPGGWVWEEAPVMEGSSLADWLALQIRSYFGWS